MTIMTAHIMTNTRWRQRPAGSTWDPGLAVREWARARDHGRLVPLGSLLSQVRQGIFAGSFGRGDLSVRTIRVSDLHPLLIGDGEVRELAVGSVRRHLAVDGDVLVARVGGLGQVGCVTQATESLVPREGILVARPMNKKWGPAIAAALCTEHSRERLSGLLVGSRSASLTIERLSDIPVPSPRHFDFAQVSNLVDAAGELVKAGCEILDRVRGHIGMVLEGAPTEPTRHPFTWVAEPAWLQGWGWSDVQRYLLISRLRLRAGSLIRLGDAIDLDAYRAKTIDVSAGIRGMESDDLRPDWYLGLPTSKPAMANESDEMPSRATPKRFFEVDRECLLVPTAGDITASPVVIPSERTVRGHPPVMVPIYWLPLVNLPHPRALAVVLDHPFVRLQRQLAGAFSKVTHINREDIANLLMPAVTEEIWNQWETELRGAHRLFIEANAKTKEAITIAERWYA